MSDNTAIGGKNNILVVEDDKFLRDLLVNRLIREGFNVVNVISGAEALENISTLKPDLIMLDLVLPGMDGYEVLKILKENPNTAGIPVMILSNLGQKDEIDKAINMGAASFLIKANFTPSEIVSKVKNILGKDSSG
ncbi:MAG: response regulator [Candidatus Niyogibacteria bacterium CG10_big_fil_rev_8_21_14_0_10_42_19]|uniref:Response regulator n=1 Tax=Candidatus Niyogibacteria bacterium CG10_big_fil_rev_8_21_14_0_10_42_19 TaxID=1974725 RepID=A0A2H0TGM9_9BACT|nr:MAG: response regulator [Candidatus Niyogibacteria bacterium CG10_big_fil_rev_8_21_14_0_10_42_19]